MRGLLPILGPWIPDMPVAWERTLMAARPVVGGCFLSCLFPYLLYYLKQLSYSDPHIYKRDYSRMPRAVGTWIWDRQGLVGLRSAPT